MRLPNDIPAAWRELIASELNPQHMSRLADFIEGERSDHLVFPPENQVFAALSLTPPDRVKVLILGQDPYHHETQAHGLAFSVPDGAPFPPSLRNILRELECDLHIPRPTSGNLTAWGKQGVLLLNSVLTVRSHEPGSHRGQGWEEITDAVFRAVNRGVRPVVFVMWGSVARSKLPWVDLSRHRVVASAHPSPLAAYRGFMGSRPFSRTNAYLRELGRAAIDWRLHSCT